MPNHANPFNPGSGVMPPFLAGRKEHLDAFGEMLDDIAGGYNTNMLLTGLRGVGKSTLLEKFREIAEERGFSVVMRSEFNKKHSVPEFFMKALRQNVSDTISDMSRTKKLAESVRKAASMARPKKLEIMGVAVEPSYEAGSMLVEDEMRKYLSSSWKIFESAGRKGVVFMFDEFHEVSNLDIKTGTILSDFIGVLNDLQKKGVGYYAVLTGLPNLELNVKKAKTYTERIFFTLKVGYLSEKDARAAITKPLKDTGTEFDDSLVDMLVEETGQYPYFIQFYCKEILSNVRGRLVTVDDFKKIRGRIEKKLDINFFDRRFADTSSIEKKVLFSLASSGSGEIPLQRIKKSGITKNTLTKTLIRLICKGLVYRHGRGTYSLSLPLFERYLRKKLQE